MLTRNQALINFVSKGPVNRETSQRSAQQAYDRIDIFLTDEEKMAISTARSHALFCNEGRQEFDRVMRPIRARLLGLKEFKEEKK